MPPPGDRPGGARPRKLSVLDSTPSRPALFQLSHPLSSSLLSPLSLSFTPVATSAGSVPPSLDTTGNSPLRAGRALHP
jgi:hypothetical protein